MYHELIMQLEEIADRIQHTKDCERNNIYIGLKCKCGAKELLETISNYKTNVWKENRNF